jgi:ABC-type lipoprotein release transport system permease subunit
MFDACIRDVRHAFRGLRSRPTYALVTILTLALVVVIVIVAAIAAAIPARRTVALDPTTALRSD